MAESEKPYPSWILEESSDRWYAPVEHPNDGAFYTWNEADQTWDAANTLSE